MKTDRLYLSVICAALTLLTGACSKPPATESGEAKSASPAAAQKPSGYRIYVTCETSGDLAIIDSNTMAVGSTVKLGKRPRGVPTPASTEHGSRQQCLTQYVFHSRSLEKLKDEFEWKRMLIIQRQH